MKFQRQWDSRCPRVWDSWETDRVKWLISDLRPEDDQEAIKLLVENLCPDETLCHLSDIVNDVISMENVKVMWRSLLEQRMSLGCYREENGGSKLVGLNVCFVLCQDEEPFDGFEGKALNNVYNAMKVFDGKVDTFKILDTDMMLNGMGLVVHKDYRGSRLGSRILAARKPLAFSQGIQATITVFTSPASQISAELAGFTTIATLTLKELSETGLDYPQDETRFIKLMAKKYL